MAEDVLLAGLDDHQAAAVAHPARRLVLIAGAGSGKTEVMARRIAWWLRDEAVERDQVVAFTFTEKAAEEMKFRIRSWVERIAAEEDDVTLGGMYVGTIHGFCIQALRTLAADEYHNYDIVDDTARVALINRTYEYLLGLRSLQQALGRGRRYGASRVETIETFLRGYDLLNEYNVLDVNLSQAARPLGPGKMETEWCKGASLATPCGDDEVGTAFAISAARYYAYLRCRRFLDFSTSQRELIRLLQSSPEAEQALRDRFRHVVVDEVQDINPVQAVLVDQLVGTEGRLTAVGDHRQAIYGWRGGHVELMAQLAEDVGGSPDGAVEELVRNFRSTKPIVELSNAWNRSINVPLDMPSPDMIHGRESRTAAHTEHVGAIRFPTRTDEADWIAERISELVEDGEGASHDDRQGIRGLTLSDVAILVRSATDVRTYSDALRARGIPSVVRAGPDLFGQPEVMVLAAALALAASMTEFLGNRPRDLRVRAWDVLGCEPTPGAVIAAGCAQLEAEGLTIDGTAVERLILAGDLIRDHLGGEAVDPPLIGRLQSPVLRKMVGAKRRPRRVFPQVIFQGLLDELGVKQWDGAGTRGMTAMFHLGQMSRLINGIETPGWTSAQEFPFQVTGLLIWGPRNARIDDAPLLVSPDAVTVTTAHSAKGLEWGAVFVADVCARRFPSQKARTSPAVPFSTEVADQYGVSGLADNANHDSERRLMYVALTRAERYLCISASGDQQSRFFKATASPPGLAGLVQVVGVFDETGDVLLSSLSMAPSRRSVEQRLVTSFSDLRYYLECPHDFYLRKALGFSPTIDQAFGYGRGIHNVLRAIHTDPRHWAELAEEPDRLEEAVRGLVESGLFYLRHTVGEPEQNMRRKAVRVIAEYVSRYRGELGTLTFEAEREFETLLAEEDILVSGAIDLIKLEDPPRVTIIDFKSGDPDSDARMSLDEQEMRLQVATYGLAAKAELQYEPERGLVRYLGEDGSELAVALDDTALAAARTTVTETAARIKDREFWHGPTRMGPAGELRCGRCDFLRICGRPEADEARS